MELKDQVCSLNLAKRLKELGVKQETLWYWYPWYAGEPLQISSWDLGEKVDAMSFDQQRNRVSAFTVAELGEMLPKDFMSYKKDDDMWLCCRHCIDTTKDNQLIEEFAETEANARAKMLIYLLENKLIEEAK